MTFNQVLVTGATGHVGNTLVRELLARGKRVRALVLPGDDLAPLHGLEVERIEGDITRPETLAAAFAGQEVVFHVAGYVTIQRGQWKRLEQINVEGTRNVLRVAKASGVRRLVYTSSIHAFPEPQPGGVLDESVGFHPDKAFGDYGRSKAAASREVLNAVQGGLDAVLVCPTGIVGPNDYLGSELGRTVEEFGHGKLQGAVAGGYDYVDVRDVALGHILAAERGRTGEAYLLTGGRLEMHELLGVLEEATGKRRPRLILPLAVAMTFAVFVEAWQTLFGGEPRLTRYALHTLASRFRVDGSKAHRELGFRPRPLREAFRDTWEWFKAKARR